MLLFFKHCSIDASWQALFPATHRYLEVVQSLAMYSYHYFEVKVCHSVRFSFWTCSYYYCVSPGFVGMAMSSFCVPYYCGCGLFAIVFRLSVGVVLFSKLLCCLICTSNCGNTLFKDKSGNQLWLGVGPNGIVQCPYENRMDPTMVSGHG